MSQPIRIMIVDDEPVARTTLRNLIAEDSEVRLVGECSNGEEALEAIRAERPDVVFLDVEMPGLDGLQLLESLPADSRPTIVFTTAFDRYATKAFDEQATDYLLKPFSDERFFVALERAKEGFRTSTLVRDQSRFADRLSIHKEGRIELVEVADLDWVQSADQYVRLHTAGGESLMRQSMGELERQLDPGRFLRIHRSAIVALDRITRLETKSGGTGRVLLSNGTWVPVSRSRVPALRSRLA